MSPEDVRKAQEAWARYLGRQVEEQIEVGNGVKMTFVLVPPGVFRMGSPDGEEWRRPGETLHEVTLTKPVALGRTEVTQAQYEALTGQNPSHYKGGERPVEQVTWEDATGSAERFTKKRGDGRLVRLPTEAEWEYACRGGRPSSRPAGVGDNRTSHSELGCFSRELGDGTRAVGSYPANALGLHDMHGNVWEWCADWYAGYSNTPATDPCGPSLGTRRVIRGGSWVNSTTGFLRSAVRFGELPATSGNNTGFRLAYTLPPGPER